MWTAEPSTLLHCLLIKRCGPGEAARLSVVRIARSAFGFIVSLDKCRVQALPWSACHVAAHPHARALERALWGAVHVCQIFSTCTRLCLRVREL